MSSRQFEIQNAEAAHHDEWASQIDVSKVDIRAHFESGSCPENGDILRWMGDLRGKRILEIGSGIGEASVYFATRGADVTAVDISTGMLSLVDRLAERHGVRVKTVLASAHDLSALP